MRAKFEQKIIPGPAMRLWPWLVLVLALGWFGLGSTLAALAQEHAPKKRVVKTMIVDDYPPYAQVNALGQPEGYIVDLARTVGAAMDLEVEIGAGTWDQALASLKNGAIDFLPMMAFTPERAKIFDFSSPHTIARDAIFQKKNGPGYDSLKDLAGKKVAVMGQDAAYDYLVASGLYQNLTPVPVETLAQALELVKTGTADAAIMPKLVGVITAKRMAEKEIDLAPPVIEEYSRPFSFAVRKGDQDLLERFNLGLSLLKTTGQYDLIRDKWFGGPEPSPFNWVLLVRAFFACLALLLGFLLWNIALGRQVKLKTLSLEAEMRRRALDQQALRQGKEEAEAANRAKSEFLANMSHEIRTPLNGILSMLQLLKNTDLNYDQTEYAQMAFLSGQRLNRLLSDILDLSRIEAQKLCLIQEPFSPREALNAVEQLFSPVASQRGLKLSFHLDADLGLDLLGDGLRLQQVLNNLVGNAIKFTTQGHVRVEAMHLPFCGPDQVRVLFSVADSGCGMDEQSLPGLFKPFSQANPSLSQAHQGAGLGLSICKRLVELMGGAICVDSALDQGTTVYFTLSLTLAKTQNQDQPRPSPAQEPLLTGLRVLLAEDDAISRLGAKKQLELMGAKVVAAEDGGLALELLRLGDFDLVLMDVQMPRMDGLSATKAIREGQAGAAKANIPILAVTAYAMSGDRERFLEAGMDGYLEKPVEKAALKAAIIRLMAAKAGSID